MATLKFADTHNMVAFLAKPTESEGFEQIVDFPNAHPIRYALMVNPTIYVSCIEQFWSTAKAKTINGKVQIHTLVDGKKIIITESFVRRDLRLADEEGVDYQVVHKERGDRLVRAATTASSLEIELDSGNIDKTHSKATPNESSSPGTTSGGGLRGNTLQSDEDRIKLNELMELCTNLQTRVLDLEKTKTSQANEIDRLKKRVKKLEKKQRSRTHKLKRLYKGRKIDDIDADEEITLVNVQDDVEMFDVNDLHGEEVFFDQEVPVKEVSTAGEVSTDKGKAIMVEEPVKPKKKVQIMLDEEAAKKLQAFFLNHEDLEQIDEFDLKEMDLKWQVAMISMRLKKFYKKIGRKLQFDAKEQLALTRPKLSASIVIRQGTLLESVDQKGIKISEGEMQGTLDIKQKTIEREWKTENQSLVTIDEYGVDWTGHAEDEQENFAWMAYSYSGSNTKVTSCSKECEESYAKLKKLYDEQREKLGDASIEIKAYTLALAKMSVKEKLGLGFSEQVKENELYDEALMSVFDSHSSDIEDAPVYDKFAKSKTSESDAKTSDFDSCESNSSVETLESMPEPVVIKPKVVSQSKVWSDTPIIEEYESDSDDEYVIKSSKEQETPSFAFDDPQHTLKGKGIVDSGCSRHMTGNKAYLVDYQEFKVGSIVFRGSKDKITGKGKIRNGKLDIDDVYFVKELQDFNLFFCVTDV
ncbi:hypothetical protein Tco_1465459 [Tanacetum coccineum]